MVRPASFGANPQTAASNAFQHPAESGAAAGHQTEALREFDALALALADAGAKVLVAADDATPVKPDAIFPNNWVSFHHDGTVALYPMLALNRRCERREDIVQRVVREGAFRVSRTIDLTHRESEQKYLEGTGSLVLDRANHVAYACTSPRTDLDVLGEFAQLLDYELVTFDAVDHAGRAVYHTNVMMAIGGGFAVICGDSMPNDLHRAAVYSRLRSTGHEIVEISHEQMTSFAGNLLELRTPRGNVIALSLSALASLQESQRCRLQAYASLVPVSIPTVERVGGGSVRCMLAEIHLPPRD